MSSLREAFVSLPRWARASTCEEVATIAYTVAEIAREYSACADPAARGTFRRTMLKALADLHIASVAVTIREDAGEVPTQHRHLRARVCAAAVEVQYAEPLTDDVIAALSSAVGVLMRPPTGEPTGEPTNTPTDSPTGLEYVAAF